MKIYELIQLLNKEIENGMPKDAQVCMVFDIMEWDNRLYKIKTLLPVLGEDEKPMIEIIVN